MAFRLVLFTLAALASANPINPGGGAERPARRHVGGVGRLARAVMVPQQPKVEVRFAGPGAPGSNGSCEDDGGSGTIGSEAEKSKDKNKDKNKDKLIVVPFFKSNLL